MPMTMDPPAPSAQRTLLSAPSLACDLSWLVSVARQSSIKSNSLASELLEGREELIDQIRSFWTGCSPETFFTELLVLAHHAGALSETSPEALWEALEGALATVPTDIGLESETPEDRAIFLRRLERLKDSPVLFRSYMDLLRQVWEPVDE